MKTTLIAAFLTAGALPLIAQGQTQTTTAVEQTVTAATATTTQPPAESALVSAAKKAGKKPATKPRTVITNKDLAKTGGHITTTKNQEPLPQVSQPDSVRDKAAQAARKKKAAEAAAKAAKLKKESDAKKKRDLERANAILEGDDAAGIYEDPATAEGRVSAQAGTTTSTSQNPQPQPAQPMQPLPVQKPPV